MAISCPPIIDANKSHELVSDAIKAGFQLDGILAMHLSPIVFGCDEGWKPLLDRIERTYGYVYEWVPAEEDACAVDWRNRWGMAVLTYIG